MFEFRDGANKLSGDRCKESGCNTTITLASLEEEACS